MRVLRSLGLESAVERAGAPLRRFAYLTQGGEMLATIDLEDLWRGVGRGCGIHRVKLLGALAAAVDDARCRLGVSVTSLKQGDRRVLAGFNAGQAANTISSSAPTASARPCVNWR